MAVVNLQPQAPPPTKQDFNTDYLRSPPGILRIAEGVLALAALICTSEGYCYSDGGRYGFFLFVLIVSLIEAILIIVVFVLHIDEKLTGVDILLSLLLNDGISLIVYFIVSTMALLSIGRCDYGVAARVLGALFALSMFLVLIGLTYINYLKWQERQVNRELAAKNAGTMGTTITELSPTVLT